MADPLSLAASIGGLLSLSGQIYKLIDTFVSNIKDAPLLARTIRSEVHSFKNSLAALNDLLFDPAFHHSRRGALISADYIVVAFTDAVLLFSELETTVIPLTRSIRSTGFSFTTKTAWALKKNALNELVSRLQWQKNTLVLLLNILKCASDIDAEQDRQALDRVICERLSRDQTMERRLQSLEEQLRMQSKASIRDGASIYSSDTRDSDNLTITPGTNISSASTSTTAATLNTTICAVPQSEFEEFLNSSWVYRRNQHREENMSFRSSVARMSAWSILSEMSLADISIIAVMALPVQLQELSNGLWYNTYPTTVSVESDVTAQRPKTFDGIHFERTYSVSATNNVIPLDSVSVHLSEIDSVVASMEENEDKMEQGQSTGILHIRDTRNSLPPNLNVPLAEMRMRVPFFDHEEDEGHEIEDDAPAEPSSSPVLSPSLENEPGDEYIYPCKGCGEILKEDKAYELAGDRWHRDCFKCNTCGMPLDSDTNLLLLGDGNLICNSCTYNCSFCGDKIEDLAILTGDQAFCSEMFLLWVLQREN